MANNERKSIGFGKEEQDIKQFADTYCKENNLKFATFVKILIREKMNATSEDEKLEKMIENKIEQYLKDREIVSIDKEESEESATLEYEEEDVSLLKAFMG